MIGKSERSCQQRVLILLGRGPKKPVFMATEHQCHTAAVRIVAAMTMVWCRTARDIRGRGSRRQTSTSDRVRFYNCIGAGVSSTTGAASSANFLQSRVTLKEDEETIFVCGVVIIGVRCARQMEV